MKRRLFRVRVSSLFMALILITAIFVGVLAFGVASVGASDVENAGSNPRSQTIITSNTTWTEANSPYILKGNVLVETDATLTIQPGVVIKFDGLYYIKVKGKLVAEGTSEKMIEFTSNKTTPATLDWKEITFELNSKDSIFKYCKIEYGGNGIVSYGPSLTIINSTFYRTGRAINIFKNPAIIENNKIINSTQIGIGATKNSQVINNLLINNPLGMSADTGSKIENNTFISNFTGLGIQLNGDVQFVNNIISDYHSGISCYHGSSIIKNNIITNLKWGGIHIGQSASPQISYNNITYIGNFGIRTSKDASAGIKINYNNLLNITNLTINNTSDEYINATNNWWGTVNPTEIDNRIYDYYDEFEFGIVNYTPYLRGPVKINTSKTNQPPIANAGPDQNAKVNQTVSFDAKSSYDPDGDILSYKWDFGDGTGTGWQNSSKSTHSYTSVGNYTVTLTVSDGKLSASDSCIVYVYGVANHGPIAYAGPDQNVKINQVVYFDGSKSYDPDGDPLTFVWYFGDGYNTSSSTASNATHIYGRAGIFNASIQVFDGSILAIDYCIISVNETVNNTNTKPIANAGPDQNVIVNQTVKFDGSKSYDPDNDPLTFKWSFGDGTGTGWSNLSTTSHIYKTTGSYIVTLTVNDSELEGQDTCRVIVVNKPNQTKNHAPVFTSTPTKEATVGKDWTYTPVVTDPDNDVVTINFTNGPQGMSFQNRTLIWKPTEAQIGNHKVSLDASDGKLKVYQNFTITVKNRTQQQNKTPPDDNDKQNKTQPQIVSSNVPNNSTNVSTNNSRIIIYFSKSMNRSSVEAAFKISPSVSYKLYWSNDDTELMITFNQQLSSNTKYSITIGNSAVDAWGNKLKDPYELKFTTQSASSKEIEEDQVDSENFNLLVIPIIILVIILILVLTFISKTRRRKKEIGDDTNGGRHEPELRGGDIAEEHTIVELNGESEEVIDQLRTEALELNKPSSYGPQTNEMLSKLEGRYKNGEISQATYESALNIINKQE